MRLPRALKNLETALVGVIVAIYISGLCNEAVLFTFQARDLARALELLQGHPIFFGPEATSGGYLPGGFYYLLLAVPLALGLGWKGTWLLLAFFHGVTAAILWRFGRTVLGGWAPALFAVLAFVSAGPISIGIRVLLNSEFIFPFVAVTLCGLVLAYTPGRDETTRARALSAAIFALALGVQLHFSLLALFPALLLLQLAGGKLGLASLGNMRWLRAQAFFFPLLPYFAWRLANALGFHFGQVPPAFATGNALGGFFLSANGNATLITFQANRIFGYGFAIKQLLLQLHEFVFDLGGLTFPAYALLVFWLIRQSHFVARNKQTDTSETPSRILFLCWIFALVPGVVGAGTGSAGARYSGLSSVAHLLFAAAALERLLASFPTLVPARATRLRRFLAVSLALLAPVYVFYYGARSERLIRNFAAVPGHETMPPAIELERLSRIVRARTGWPYARFRESAFFLNVFNEMTIQANYEEEESVAAPANLEGPAPDGFFIGRRTTPAEQEASLRDPRAWLVAQRLPEPVGEGVRNGAITLGVAEEVGSLLLVPYSVREPLRYPSRFQNRSEHYENTQHARINEAQQTPGAIVAVFHACPNEASYCRVALVAKGEGLRDASATLHVDVLGIPLSLSTMHINPAWTQSIHEPYITWRCAGSAEVRTERLAGIVGFDPIDNWLLNHSFLAPYRREVALGCRRGSRLTELRLGYRSATVINISGVSALPGAERVFHP